MKSAVNGYLVGIRILGGSFWGGFVYLSVTCIFVGVLFKYLFLYGVGINGISHKNNINIARQIVGKSVSDKVKVIFSDHIIFKFRVGGKNYGSTVIRLDLQILKPQICKGSCLHLNNIIEDQPPYFRNFVKIRHFYLRSFIHH